MIDIEVVDQLKRIADNVLSFAWVKALISVLAVGFAWVFDDSRGSAPAIIVAILICLDSITGMLASVKTGEGLSSKKAKRIVWKFLVYSIAIITGRLVDKVLPTPAFAVVIEVFLALTEGQSIIENLGRYGMPLPKKLSQLFSLLKDK